MKKALLCAAMLSASSYSFAEANFCQLEDVLAVTNVIWDAETGAAKFTAIAGDAFMGTITNVKRHDSGHKLNLRFHFGKSKFIGFDSAEFIVFPVGRAYRVIGVGYIEKDGVEHLSGLIANSAAACVNL